MNAQIIKKELPEKVVILSFDDACVSQYKTVAPLLKKYDFNATFFICEFPKSFSDTTKYMTWKQIKALNDMGFEIGNHTRTHAHINGLHEQEINNELNYIENKCHEYNINKPVSFAYPGYGLNTNSVHVIQKLGYSFARAGGSRTYNPLKDFPLLIPSWATNANNKDEIMKALKKAKKNNIVVLTLHGVPDLEHPWVTTPPNMLKEYFEFLSANDYTVLSFKDLLRYIDVDEAQKTISPDFTLPLKN